MAMNYDFISISQCELQQKCLVSDQTCILMVMVAKVDISTTNLFCTLFKLHSKLLKTSILNWFFVCLKLYMVYWIFIIPFTKVKIFRCILLTYTSYDLYSSKFRSRCLLSLGLKPYHIHVQQNTLSLFKTIKTTIRLCIWHIIGLRTKWRLIRGATFLRAMPMWWHYSYNGVPINLSNQLRLILSEFRWTDQAELIPVLTPPLRWHRPST